MYTGQYVLHVYRGTRWIIPKNTVGYFPSIDAAAEYAHVEFKGRVVEYPQDV
jgi:hypothetical protein